MSFLHFSAPRIASDVVVIGNSGAEFEARGYISAYAIKTGALRWRICTVPGDPKLPFEHPELEWAATTSSLPRSWRSARARDAREDATILGLEATREVFDSTIEQEDYAMGEKAQQSAESGLLSHLVFGRNEPALHHYHNTFREALNLPPLERVD